MVFSPFVSLPLGKGWGWAFTRKTFTILSLFALTFSSIAQVTFWTEDFGIGCNQGQGVSSYSGTNGAWSMSTTGANGAAANTWFVSATEAGMGVGNCGDGCISTPALTNRTLHLGDSFVPDMGAAYYTGFTFDATTNKRAETPTINCSLYNTIELDFDYFMRGEFQVDFAEIFFSDDGGSSWNSLVQPIATVVTCPFDQGLWTLHATVPLPASANNNPNVKLGFNWTNNNNALGSDPSFAIDNITLTGVTAPPPPVADFYASDTVICDTVCIDFFDQSTGSPTSWAWTFFGGTPATSNLQNPTNICYAAAGMYDVMLIAGNGNGWDTLLLTNYIEVLNCAPPIADFSASDTTVCLNDCIDFTDLSSNSPNGWLWTFEGAATAFSILQNPTGICYDTAGTYNVTLETQNGFGNDSITWINYITVIVCPGIDEPGTNNLITVFPNPMSESALIEVNPAKDLEHAVLSMYNMLGEKIKANYSIKTNGIEIYRGTLPEGVYLIEIRTDEELIGKGTMIIR